MTSIRPRRQEIAKQRTHLVSFDIDTLLRAAAWHWRGSGVRISPGALARAINVMPITIAEMRANRTLQINLELMGLVAWFFGIQSVDQLIHYGPPSTSESVPELEADLVQLGYGEATTQIDTLPQLDRRSPPTAPPASGSIIVVNHIPELLASTSHKEIAAMIGQPQPLISRLARRQIKRIARATLADLMDALGLEKVSDVLEVRLSLDAVSSDDTIPPDAVRIEAPEPVWRTTDWGALAQQWRAIAQIDPGPGSLDAIDVAAIRYIYRLIAGNRSGRPPRLGGQLAAALGVSRQAINGVADNMYRPQATPEDLPPEIPRLLQETLGLRPRDLTNLPAHAEAATPERAGTDPITADS